MDIGIRNLDFEMDSEQEKPYSHSGLPIIQQPRN